MSNNFQQKILIEGTQFWNQWRDRNKEVQIDLTSVSLHEQKLSKANFAESVLSFAIFSSVDLSGADFYRSLITEVNFSKANLTEADLTNANAYKSDFSFANLFKVSFSFANLSRSIFFKSHLLKANLNGANLHDANLSYADLSGAYLTKANMYRAKLINAKLLNTNLKGANLSETDFTGADLSGANLNRTDLTGANLKGANLRGASLEGAILVNTVIDQAVLIDCSIYGLSVWDLVGKPIDQVNLTITPKGQAAITVDDLEVAQFIYLLLNNSKIRNVIENVTSKVVLILGRFTDKRKAVLDAVRDELRKQNFTPILFDFDKPASKDVTGTVETLARLARFIIADITDPSSIPHELASIVPFLRTTPVLPLRLQSAVGYSMFEDFQGAYKWVLKTHEYIDSQHLIAELPQIIAPANSMAEEFRNSHL
jgi:uncharacterized protein YjbI with pentapeptide repeats